MLVKMDQVKAGSADSSGNAIASPKVQPAAPPSPKVKDDPAPSAGPSLANTGLARKSSFRRSEAQRRRDERRDSTSLTLTLTRDSDPLAHTESTRQVFKLSTFRVASYEDRCEFECTRVNYAFVEFDSCETRFARAAIPIPIQRKKVEESAPSPRIFSTQRPSLALAFAPQLQPLHEAFGDGDER